MKVESIYKRTMEGKPFEQYCGFCPVCHELVRMDSYGVDEECPGCGADLEWDVKNNSIGEWDWIDDLNEELEYIRESERQMEEWV